MTPLAHAVLGEPLALPANASRAQAAAAPRSALPAGVQMVERASGDGGWIREYVSPQGIVFAFVLPGRSVAAVHAALASEKHFP